MREIFFRAKRIDNGEWVEGLLFFSHGTGMFKITMSNGWSPTYGNPDEGESTVYVDIDSETVGQFTGLKDKNGVYIYEGDIITINGKSPSGKTEFIVTFEDGCFCIREKDSTNFAEAVCFRQNLSNAKNANTLPVYEVIGNIHENPELLK